MQVIAFVNWVLLNMFLIMLAMSLSDSYIGKHVANIIASSFNCISWFILRKIHLIETLQEKGLSDFPLKILDLISSKKVLCIFICIGIFNLILLLVKIQLENNIDDENTDLNIDESV